MLFNSFYLLALHLLLQAHQTLADEDHTLMETEFRLFLFTGDPDTVQVTYDDENGKEIVAKSDDFDDNWAPGADARSGDGNWPLTEMVWSRVNETLRTVWIHDKGTDKESGRKCSIYLNHDPQVPRLDWYLQWGLDVESTMNEFQDLDEFRIVCVDAET